MIISTQDCLRRIAECDDALQNTELQNVREQIERAKKAWESMLKLDQGMQDRRNAIKEARLNPPS